MKKKIKPKSNKVSTNNDKIINIFKDNTNKIYNEDKLKPRTLEHQNEINYLLNCSSFSNNQYKEKENSSIKSKEIDLSVLVNKYRQYSSENVDDECNEDEVIENNNNYEKKIIKIK